MNNIPSSNFGYGRINAYRPAAPAPDVQQPAEVQQVQQTRQVEARQAVRAAAGDLTAAEQQMIDRYFPDSSAMTLRLYGPNRSAQNVNPNAVGGRLDLKG